MSLHTRRTLIGICGIIGVVMLITSFIVNPGPPANAPVAQLLAFANANRTLILLGAWLQTLGSFLCIVFAVAVVHLAGAMQRLVGWLTLLGGTILVLVSLMEVNFYFTILSNDPTTVTLGQNLIADVQHDYSLIAAPAVFFPLGAVVWSSSALPRFFAYFAFVLGAVFAIFGPLALFAPLQTVVNVLAGVQGLWFLGAAIALFFRPQSTQVDFVARPLGAV